MTLSKSQISAITNLLYECGEIARKIRYCPLEITIKPDNSPVTRADTEISEIISKSLGIITPNIPVISEEGDMPSIVPEEYWLLDPIDGTKGYISGENYYTINLGLIKNKEPKSGFIFLPEQRTLYYTIDCKKVFFEIEKQLHDIEFYNSKVIRATFSSYRCRRAKKLMEVCNISEYVISPGAVKFCHIATGMVDLYPRFSQTMEWDTAAGHAIIRASGGEVFDMEGNILLYGKPSFINESFLACSTKVVKDFEGQNFKQII